MSKVFTKEFFERQIATNEEMAKMASKINEHEIARKLFSIADEWRAEMEKDFPND